MEMTKHYANCYRVRNGGEYFGQIKKSGRTWTADIHKSSTGDLVRFAGIWATRKAAFDEISHILERGHI